MSSPHRLAPAAAAAAANDDANDQTKNEENKNATKEDKVVHPIPSGGDAVVATVVTASITDTDVKAAKTATMAIAIIGTFFLARTLASLDSDIIKIFDMFALEEQGHCLRTKF